MQKSIWTPTIYRGNLDRSVDVQALSKRKRLSARASMKKLGIPHNPSTVPTYQQLMLPLLRFAADGTEHRINEALQPIAEFFNLDATARNEVLPDGRNKLRHRLEWARTFLKQAGLLEYPQRAVFKITDRGSTFVAGQSKDISVNDLMRLPDFAASRERRTTSAVDADEPAAAIDPEEALESGYEALRRSVEDDLLSKVKTSPPEFFERIVIDLLLAMGYGGPSKEQGKAIGRSGDGGIDGIINEDILGLEVVYVQAKRWSDVPVGRPDIQQFVGALESRHARKGVFLTTSRFSKEARDYVQRIATKVVLVDGAQLAKLMFDHNIGVSEAKAYRVKRIDSDYFEQE